MMVIDVLEPQLTPTADKETEYQAAYIIGLVLEQSSGLRALTSRLDGLFALACSEQPALQKVVLRALTSLRVEHVNHDPRSFWHKTRTWSEEVKQQLWQSVRRSSTFMGNQDKAYLQPTATQSSSELPVVSPISPPSLPAATSPPSDGSAAQRGTAAERSVIRLTESPPIEGAISYAASQADAHRPAPDEVSTNGRSAVGVPSGNADVPAPRDAVHSSPGYDSRSRSQAFGEFDVAGDEDDAISAAARSSSAPTALLVSVQGPRASDSTTIRQSYADAQLSSVLEAPPATSVSRRNLLLQRLMLSVAVDSAPSGHIMPSHLGEHSELSTTAALQSHQSSTRTSPLGDSADASSGAMDLLSNQHNNRHTLLKDNGTALNSSVTPSLLGGHPNRTPASPSPSSTSSFSSPTSVIPMQGFSVAMSDFASFEVLSDEADTRIVETSSAGSNAKKHGGVMIVERRATALPEQRVRMLPALDSDASLLCRT
jgi:hypothetical protein